MQEPLPMHVPDGLLLLLTSHSSLLVFHNLLPFYGDYRKYTLCHFKWQNYSSLFLPHPLPPRNFKCPWPHPFTNPSSSCENFNHRKSPPTLLYSPKNKSTSLEWIINKYIKTVSHWTLPIHHIASENPHSPIHRQKLHQPSSPDPTESGQEEKEEDAFAGMVLLAVQRDDCWFIYFQDPPSHQSRGYLSHGQPFHSTNCGLFAGIGALSVVGQIDMEWLWRSVFTTESCCFVFISLLVVLGWCWWPTSDPDNLSWQVLLEMIWYRRWRWITRTIFGNTSSSCGNGELFNIEVDRGGKFLNCPRNTDNSSSSSALILIKT